MPTKKPSLLQQSCASKRHFYDQCGLKVFVAVVLPYKCVSCVDFLSSRKCVMHFRRVPCRHKHHKKLQIVKSIIKCREETAQAFSFLIVINALIICHMRNQWRHKNLRWYERLQTSKIEKKIEDFDNFVIHSEQIF